MTGGEKKICIPKSLYTVNQKEEQDTKPVLLYSSVRLCFFLEGQLHEKKTEPKKHMDFFWEAGIRTFG